MAKDVVAGGDTVTAVSTARLLIPAQRLESTAARSLAQWSLKRHLLLVGADAAAILLTVMLGYATAATAPSALDRDGVVSVVALLVVGWVAALEVSGSRQRRIAARDALEYWRVITGTVGFFASIAAAVLLLRQDVPDRLFLVTLPLGVIYLLGGRLAARHLLAKPRLRCPEREPLPAPSGLGLRNAARLRRSYALSGYDPCAEAVDTGRAVVTPCADVRIGKPIRALLRWWTLVPRESPVAATTGSNEGSRHGGNGHFVDSLGRLRVARSGTPGRSEENDARMGHRDSARVELWDNLTGFSGGKSVWMSRVTSHRGGG